MEPKPGIRTSEFWLSLLATLAGAYASSKPTDPRAQAVGTLATVLPGLVYTFGRSRVKAAAAPTPPPSN